MKINCAHCGNECDFPTGRVNWAKKMGAPIYCNSVCMGLARQTHGETSYGKRGSKEYNAWASMKKRCYNKNMHNYKRYGALGIRVCKRWRDSYLNFLEDMGRAPSKSHSIERINGKGNYEPSNCKWATNYEQSQNRPSIVKLNKYIVQYIRQRKATAKTIVKELNGVCSPDYIYSIRSKIRWANIKIKI